MDNNLFTRFCVKGLERTYIPSENVFAFSRKYSGGQFVHLRDRFNEYRFTMNALMGLYHAQAQGISVFLDIESDYHGMAARIEEMTGSPIDIAATVWTGRSIGTEIPHKVTLLFHNLLENAPQLKPFGAKTLAWSIVACITGGEEYYTNAFTLAKFAADKWINAETKLVKSRITGIRNNWSSFGSHSYLAYAFLLLARKCGSSWARDLGLSITRRLVQLQGPEGQWGWMYHVPSGRLADYYPVYSVHQYAYAPFFLVEAIDQGYDEFREPLVRGFNWILGKNELGQCMMEPTNQIIWRGVFRNSPNSRLIKVLRANAIIHFGLEPAVKGANAVHIDTQCWGFEMALPLCVFSGRSDFDEILNNRCFL